ncbi:MAG: PolC-type DNA polymerase III [Bacilli bacterium]|jgi:DNA polymerase-3 subunit alpha (Gram-positive type)|nr:PolC-type DNA polymerase III [Bacilli bacterium]
MQNKMIRFLSSLGLPNPERFDMSFDLCGRDPSNPGSLLMSIRKSTPWSISMLEEFKDSLVNITYPYTIRFSYEKEPNFDDIDDLFQNWYLSFYHGIPSFQLSPGKEGEIYVFADENEITKTSKGIVSDFNAFLKWLGYPYEVSFKPFVEEKETAQKAEPVEKPAEKEETAPVEPAPVKEENKVEENTEEDSPAEEEKEDSCSSNEDDEEEMARQAALKAAEEEYIAQMKAENNNRPTYMVFRKGDYTEVKAIKDLFEMDLQNVEFEGKIFSKDIRLGRKGTMFGTYGIADEDSAIGLRACESRNGLSGDDMNGIGPGNIVKIRGALENDKRTGVRQVFVHYVDHLPNPPLRNDPEPEKRVELHLHTKMSVMDGLGEINDYVAVAKNMGMKALAVTDHGVIQSFPAAESAAKKSGLKILYGCEFYMFDYPTYVFNPVDIPLRKAKYCVFDFETTGLSSRYDHATMFGAVIVENGLITKRLGQFIDPGVHIPEKITAKTRITDEMVKGQPTEIEAAKIISDFIGDTILVSHNAPFDMGFLNAIRKKAGMGPCLNPVVDTLALSHYLFPEAGRHTLGALSRNLNLEVYDEDDAHQADYDAEALNNVWQAIIPILTKDNLDLTHKDLATLVCPNQAIFKHLKSYHVCAIAKNQAGVKELYRLISDSHTAYLAAGSLPKIPRKELQDNRADLMFGSACFNGEIFELASNKSEEELASAMSFYDYIEVQPMENYSWLVNMGELSEERLTSIVKSIISTADSVGKMVCATGDCHYVNPDDKICRDVYISAKGLGGILHPLAPHRRDNMPAFPNPDQHFRSTKEMLDCFIPLVGEEKAREIVIANTNKIADQVEPVVILKDHLYPPSANLPHSDEKIKEVIAENVRKTYGDHPNPAITERLDKELHGIIENGYSVTYYIAHLIIKKANEDGYIVGSRGSVGSSFVATMSGITEVNPLKPHYVCPHCHHFEWSTDPKIRSGFDLPEKKCPECGEMMVANGQSIPFETFLGFNAEKVPDIDLNFPPDYQSKAHAYARTLLSTKEENERIEKGLPISNPHVIRAGTIATVEDKNAFGYIHGYYDRVVHADWGKVNKAWVAFLATRCTGVKRTTGQHPGGIVVIPADMDIFDFTPYQHPADDPTAEWLTTHYEFASMHDSVLKLDLLGHVDPQALRMMSLLTKIDVRSIPMNDKKVLSLFSSTKALGMKTNPLGFETGAIALPEFGTNFVQGLLKEAKPKTFNDLLIISGLSHGTDVWNNNAEDLIKDKTATLDEVIGCRDDIMNTLIDYGVPNSMAFTIMEKVRHGKGLTPEMEKVMHENNVPQYYIDSCKKIKYLFPRAHATAYVIGACRVGWFKIYHPLEFYATYFSVRCDKFDIETMSSPMNVILDKIAKMKEQNLDKMNPLSDKDIEIMKTLTVATEMIDRGYKIENISLMESLADRWVVCHERNSIIPPFTVISGLGMAAAQTVVDTRKDGEFISIEDIKERTKLSQSDIAELKKLGVLEGLGDTNQMSLF